MARAPEEIAFEAEYWKQAADDIAEILRKSAEIREALFTTGKAVVGMTTVFVEAKPKVDACDQWMVYADPLNAALEAGLEEVGGIYDRLEALANLAAGRMTALATEFKSQQEGDPT